MKILLSPQRRDDILHVVKYGDVLTVNGVAFDFTGVPEGAILPADAVDCDFVCGPVERTGGELVVPLILPHKANAPHHMLFPEPLTNVPDGVVALPAWEPEPEPAYVDEEELSHAGD